MSTIGERYKELRKKNHLTQEEVGKIVGLHGTNVGRIEANKVSPTADVLLKTMDHFCVTADWLLTGIQTSQALSILWEQLTEKDQKELIQIMEYKISQYPTEGKLSNSKVEDQNINEEDIA